MEHDFVVKVFHAVRAEFSDEPEIVAKRASETVQRRRKAQPELAARQERERREDLESQRQKQEALRTLRAKLERQRHDWHEIERKRQQDQARAAAAHAVRDAELARRLQDARQREYAEARAARDRTAAIQRFVVAPIRVVCAYVLAVVLFSILTSSGLWRVNTVNSGTPLLFVVGATVFLWNVLGRVFPLPSKSP
jgi:hypothetical protein